MAGSCLALIGPSAKTWAICAPSAVLDCSASPACNAAMLNGGSIDNLIYSTVKISRSGIEPFPSCLNCQVILQGAKEELP